MLESEHFKTYFGLIWNSANDQLPDGAYYVDHDGHLFAHILLYMCLAKYPLFFDAKIDHDHVLCQAVLSSAKFFQVQQLED